MPPEPRGILAGLLAEVQGRPPVAVPLDEAAGLVLGADVVAERDLPGFDNSGMDGFAVHSIDTVAATADHPVRLPVVGEVAAGDPDPGRLAAGTAVRIMTGAPVPPGCDAVVEVERTRVEGGDLLLDGPVEAGRSIRGAGEDIRAGELALRAGTVVGAGQVALLAALGVARPVCVPRPRVVVDGRAPVLDAVRAAAFEAGATVVRGGDAGDFRVAPAPGDGSRPALAMDEGLVTVFLPGAPGPARAAFEAVVEPAIRALAGRGGAGA